MGTYRFPDDGIEKYAGATTLMGQSLLNPPTVEGWHTGREWINGGTLNERVNFAVDEVGDVTKPGIGAIVDRLRAEGDPLSPEQLVDGCLDLAGPVPVGDEVRGALLRFAQSGGPVRFGTEAERDQSASRVAGVLQIIVATREYQFA